MPLYSFPLTRERFLLTCSKPEAFEGIDPETLTLLCEQESDRTASALGDRATLPILEWDGALDGATVARVARRAMAFRGYKRSAGADGEFVDLAKEADEFLARCRPGGATGKSENPRFVDSGSNAPRDAVKVISQQTSDAWIRRGGRCGGCG